MDKNLFISLLHRYSGSSAEEAEKILLLKSEYPYSQILHTLAARVTKDHGLQQHQEALQLAAVHAADRSVLKEIINAQTIRQDSLNGGAQVSEKEVATPREVIVTEALTHTIKSIDAMDIADEVILDLERLNTLKHNFEMLFVEYSEVKASELRREADVIPPKPATLEKKEVPKPPKATPKENSKSKKQRIIELAKAMHATEHGEEKDAKPSPKKKKNADQPDELIEEIQATKKEIKPENEKQKQQIALINQFIKTQPSITSARERQTSPIGDLNPIKSGEFGDNIVSETLVEILIKQGKKDKAVEVLKKLIWKYPQKKSYFASQIEDLKK